MEKTVFIFGHKNPDTDAVVAAAAYAKLKEQFNMDNAQVAERIGKNKIYQEDKKVFHQKQPASYLKKGFGSL